MTRFGTLVSKVDIRSPGIDLPLLSVSQTRGVLRQSELSDRPPRADSLDTYKVCRRHDIVFNKMSIRAGAMGVAQEDGLVTYHYEVMRPKPGVDPRYVVYLMKSSQFTRELIMRERGIGAGPAASGVRTTEVPFSVMRTIDLELPEPGEQRRIAEFLDRETAQIDELIAKQEQLIATLAERLSAEIHAAVTAGTERVGTVQLRHVALVLDCKHITADFVEDGFPLASIGETRDEFVELEKAKRTTKGYFDLLREGGRDPRPGDLVFTRNATVGNVSRVGDFTEPFALGQDVCLIRPSRRELDPAFLQAQLQGPLIRSQLDGFMIGSTFKRVNVQQVRSLRLVVPDLSFQEEVVALVRRKRVETEVLIARTQSVVDLLRERRQALISAAVTGQIDAGGTPR